MSPPEHKKAAIGLSIYFSSWSSEERSSCHALPLFRCSSVLLSLWLLFVYYGRTQDLAAALDDPISTHFKVTVDGQPATVMHAAVADYFANFDVSRRTVITITSDIDGFWDKGVEVEPWRLGIRPKRDGRKLTFTLEGPAKISISRPNDFLAPAEMLFLFANKPEADVPIAASSGLRFFSPGLHREDINAATGDRIYLAPGAVVFGALNLWGVDHVKVFGRGVIVYDGPQNPENDDGWMHKKNWHCITMDNAHDITIEGITCVVRSRTWQIQMKNSRGIRFDNIKVIGANIGNANADGMDWLGGGDTVVHDSFFRAADDIFAMQSSWEGYGAKAFALQGQPVTNIVVDDSVLSTSVSNIVRAGWPKKNFEGGDFQMRNTDVLHMGMGGCGVPFALMEVWADPNGRGRSDGFTFEDVRLEHWYSLTQLMEPVDGVHAVSFRDVAGLETSSLAPSVLKGKVTGVSLANVEAPAGTATRKEDLALEVKEGAEEPKLMADGPQVRMVHTEGLLRPAKKVRFEALLPDGGNRRNLRFEWSFGDGTYAYGRKVKHRFPDVEGTLLDGSGRFRVLLKTQRNDGRVSWTYAPVVIADHLTAAVTIAGAQPGLMYRYFEMRKPTLNAMADDLEQPVATGIAQTLRVTGLLRRAEQYGVAFEGVLNAPADGGYVLTLLANDAGRLSIDGKVVAVTPEPFANVCGLAGNAVRPATASMVLAKGYHRLEVLETHTTGNDGFRLWWQGPSVPFGEIPSAMLFHIPQF